MGSLGHICRVSETRHYPVFDPPRLGGSENSSTSVVHQHTLTPLLRPHTSQSQQPLESSMASPPRHETAPAAETRQQGPSLHHWSIRTTDRASSAATWKWPERRSPASAPQTVGTGTAELPPHTARKALSIPEKEHRERVQPAV